MSRGERWLRPKASTAAPVSGKSKIQTSAVVSKGPRLLQLVGGSRSASQRVDVVHVCRVPFPEKQHDDGQPDGHLRRRHGDDQEREDVPFHVAQMPGERDESQVGRVEHDLHAHQHHQRAPAEHQPGGPDDKQNPRKRQVSLNHVPDQPVSAPYSCRRPTRTTTPITAASSTKAVSSNAKMCVVSSSRPTAAADPKPEGSASLAGIRPSPADAATAIMRTAPPTAVTRPSSLWPSSLPSVRSMGSFLAVSSAMTKRKRIMIAPA